MTWHPMEPVDRSFFETAPVVHRNVIDLPASPERVWEQLASDDSIAAWGVGLKLTWTSERPFEVGTTRHAVLPGGLELREEFFRWDEGRGYSFCAVEATKPKYLRFAEDYEVEPGPEGARLTWTMATEAAPGRGAALTTLVDRLTGPAYKLVLRRGRRWHRQHPAS